MKKRVRDLRRQKIGVNNKDGQMACCQSSQIPEKSVCEATSSKSNSFWFVVEILGGFNFEVGREDGGLSYRILMPFFGFLWELELAASRSIESLYPASNQIQIM